LALVFVLECWLAALLFFSVFQKNKCAAKCVGAKTMTKKMAALTAWSAVAEVLAGGILFHIFYKAGEGVLSGFILLLIFIDVAGLCSYFIG
jgi:hypothetical protein